MSWPRKPVDNTPVEVFFSLLKKEVFYNNSFKSMREYLTKAKTWLNFYNTKRIRLNFKKIN